MTEDPFLIDLLAIDAATGKNWLQIGKEYRRKQLRAEIYQKHRQKYLAERRPRIPLEETHNAPTANHHR